MTDLTEPQLRTLNEIEGGEKFCNGCKEIKPLTEFHRHRRTGLQSRCKACQRAYRLRNQAKNREKVAEYQRRWRKEVNPAKAVAGYRHWMQANPEKRKAYAILKRAVASGRVVRPKECERCGGSTELHGHHEDYAKPLDVIWVCPPCHSAIHAERDGRGREVLADA